MKTATLSADPRPLQAVLRAHLMPRVRTVCTHVGRAAIDAALVAGKPYRNRAEQYGASATALHRHKQDHVPASLVKAHEAEDLTQTLDVVKQLKAINGASLQILSDARRAGDGDLALKAIDRIHTQIELQGKIKPGQGLTSTKTISTLAQAQYAIEKAQREIRTLHAQLDAWQQGTAPYAADPAFYREMLVPHEDLLAEWLAHKADLERLVARA